jgi:hypothetical protein
MTGNALIEQMFSVRRQERTTAVLALAGIARASVTGISAGVEKNRLDCTNRITEGIAADHAPIQAFRW